jgi:plasmid stabilization system protein ParE
LAGARGVGLVAARPAHEMTRENFDSPQAEQDIATILRWTQQHFGKRGRLRYEALLVRAIIDMRVHRVRSEEDGVSPSAQEFAHGVVHRRQRQCLAHREFSKGQRTVSPNMDHPI